MCITWLLWVFRIAYGYVRSVMSDVVFRLEAIAVGESFILAIYRSVHAHIYSETDERSREAALCKWQFSLHHIASIRCVGCAVAHNSTLQILLPHKFGNFWAISHNVLSSNVPARPLPRLCRAHISIIWPFLHKLFFSARTPPSSAGFRFRSPQIKTLRLNKKPIDYSSFRRANNENDSNMRRLYSHQQMFAILASTKAFIHCMRQMLYVLTHPKK